MVLIRYKRSLVNSEIHQPPPASWLYWLFQLYGPPAQITCCLFLLLFLLLRKAPSFILPEADLLVTCVPRARQGGKPDEVGWIENNGRHFNSHAASPLVYQLLSPFSSSSEQRFRRMCNTFLPTYKDMCFV